jgi:hypothetical protein
MEVHHVGILPRCANCGAEIPWKPVVHREHAYCCGGCAQGGPCYCSYDLATKKWIIPTSDCPGPSNSPNKPQHRNRR